MERDKVGKAIRSIFKIIKAHHHLDNLRMEGQVPGPQQLRKITAWLGEVIWPADPNDATQSRIENNAEGWLVSSLQILKDHYTVVRNGGMEELRTLELTDEEKRRAVEVACRWAKNKVKTLKQGVLQEALKYIDPVQDNRYAQARRQGQVQQEQQAQDEQQVQHEQQRSQQERVQQERQSIVREDQQAQDEQQGQQVQLEEQLQLEQAQQERREEQQVIQSLQEEEAQSTTGLSLQNTEDSTNSEGLHRKACRKRQDMGIFVRAEGTSGTWKLQPNRPKLIIGDSNMGRFPMPPQEGIQIVCYPGARWTHMYSLFRYNTPTSPEVEVVIIAVGINDRKANPSLVCPAISRSYKAARTTFPNALVYVPQISFSGTLTSAEKKRIRDMNDHIRGLEGTIPPLQPPAFGTERDGVHWTPATANRILQNWQNYLEAGDDWPIWEDFEDNSQKIVGDSVMNLSKKVKLNKDQIDLLYKGVTETL